VAVLFLVLTAVYTRLWENYTALPVLLIVPAGAVASLFVERYYIRKRLLRRAFFSSAAVIGLSALFGVLGLFPDLLPSTLNRGYGLTIRNAASTPLTLTIMLVVAVIVVPAVMLYQAWVYRLFRRDITAPESTAETVPEEVY
jgi:cytochrome d ubiquinol oxidase subunit II